MSLMRRDQFNRWNDLEQSMNRMRDRMRSMLDSSLMPIDNFPTQNLNANLLSVDMTSDDKQVIVRTEVPGFKEDEINVEVQGNMLTISAESTSEREDDDSNWHIREMRYGKFSRSVMLPDEVNVDRTDATLENGILTVKLPKVKPNPIQKIAVKARNLLTGGKQNK